VTVTVTEERRRQGGRASGFGSSAGSTQISDVTVGYD